MPQYPQQIASCELPNREPAHYQDNDIYIDTYLAKFIIALMILGPMLLYIGVIMYLSNTLDALFMISFVMILRMLSHFFSK